MTLRLIVAVALAGCAPAVAWRAWSPDLRHELVVLREGEADRVRLDGVELGVYPAALAGSAVFLRDGSARFVVRDGGEHRIAGGVELPPFLDVELPLRALDGSLVVSAADREGWHVVSGDRLGPAFPASAVDLRAAAGRVVYVGRSGSSERVVDGESVGPPFDDVRLLTLGDGGRVVAYAGVLGGREHLVTGTGVGPSYDDVLELAAAADAPVVAAIIGEGEGCELMRLANGELRTLAAAPLLTHLRVSASGARVACLRPAPDGSSISLLVDGAVISEHRRIDGERLGFSGERIVWLAEDAQGIVVRADGFESERYEEIEGPVLWPGLGFIGRRDERSEVFVEGERVGEEPYATELRVGPGGTFAYLARRPEGRFVVTRRGSWPVPRFFVDTLRLDASGEHWAALVPDAAERVISVWVDGEPVREVPLEDVIGPALAAGLDAEEVLHAVVEAVLEDVVGDVEAP